jgi:hypothetical protein
MQTNRALLNLQCEVQGLRAAPFRPMATIIKALSQTDEGAFHKEQEPSKSYNTKLRRVISQLVGKVWSHEIRYPFIFDCIILVLFMDFSEVYGYHCWNQSLLRKHPASTRPASGIAFCSVARGCVSGSQAAERDWTRTNSIALVGEPPTRRDPSFPNLAPFCTFHNLVETHQPIIVSTFATSEIKPHDSW